MPSPLEVRDWHELDVFSSGGQSVGKLIDVYVNNESGEPEFLLVASGFLHNRLHLAPAEAQRAPRTRRSRSPSRRRRSTPPHTSPPTAISAPTRSGGSTTTTTWASTSRTRAAF